MKLNSSQSSLCTDVPPPLGKIFPESWGEGTSVHRLFPVLLMIFETWKRRLTFLSLTFLVRIKKRNSRENESVSPCFTTSLDFPAHKRAYKFFRAMQRLACFPAHNRALRRCFSHAMQGLTCFPALRITELASFACMLSRAFTHTCSLK